MGSTPTGISASRGAAILGLSQWSTELDVWTKIQEERKPGFCQAHGITPPERTENAAMRWGTAFEDAVIRLAEVVHNQRIGAREALFELAGDVPITCHVDGIYGVQSGPANANTPLHEGKTTNAYTFREKWGEPGSDRVPREYAVQVQHQMACTGATNAIVSVLVFPRRVDEWEAEGWIPETEKCTDYFWFKEKNVAVSEWASILAQMGFFHQYPITADPTAQTAMLEAYRSFWFDHVIKEIPPEPSTWADILRLFPEPRGTVIANEEQTRLATEYSVLTKEIGAAKKQQEIIKTAIMSELERGAEHPIDSDSVEAIVMRDTAGKKLCSLSKSKAGKISFRG